MFAGADTADDVVHNLSDVGNVINMELHAYVDYYDLNWGIEAIEEGGKVRFH
jgi:hypothetical protein